MNIAFFDQNHRFVMPTIFLKWRLDPTTSSYMRVTLNRYIARCLCQGIKMRFVNIFVSSGSQTGSLKTFEILNSALPKAGGLILICNRDGVWVQLTSLTLEFKGNTNQETQTKHVRNDIWMKKTQKLKS